MRPPFSRIPGKKIAGYLFRFPAWVCRWWTAVYLVFGGLLVRQTGIVSIQRIVQMQYLPCQMEIFSYQQGFQ